MTKLPPCPHCAAHEGRSFTRGIREGIRMLTQAVARGDTKTAKDLILMAYRPDRDKGGQ